MCRGVFHLDGGADRRLYASLSCFILLVTLHVFNACVLLTVFCVCVCIRIRVCVCVCVRICICTYACFFFSQVPAKCKPDVCAVGGSLARHAAQEKSQWPPQNEPISRNALPTDESISRNARTFCKLSRPNSGTIVGRSAAPGWKRAPCE